MDVTHAGVTVADLERSLWFYRDLLGLEVVRRYVSKSDVARVMWNAPGLQQLESAMVHLPGGAQEVQLTQATGDFGGRRDHLDASPWDLGAARLTVPVADLPDLVGRMGANGFVPRSGEVVVGTEGLRAGVHGACYADPDGLFVDLVQAAPGSGDAQPMRAGITVADLDRSIWFYRDALGMEALTRGDGDLAFTRAVWAAPALTSVATAVLHLPGFAQQLELTQVGGVTQQRLAGHQWDAGFAHVCFIHDDLTALFELLDRHEIRPKAVVRGMIDSWVVGSHCPDPDGFDLELLPVNSDTPTLGDLHADR